MNTDLLKLEMARNAPPENIVDLMDKYEKRNAELVALVAEKDHALGAIVDLITERKKTSYYILNECRDVAKAATK